jgi:hypothetical protein
MAGMLATLGLKTPVNRGFQSELGAISGGAKKVLIDSSNAVYLSSNTQILI